MENRSYRPEDVRYYESDSSSTHSGFEAFGEEDPNRPPTPPPPPIRPNADFLPFEELNVTEMGDRIRRDHEARIAYWDPSPSDPPLRRPMRAPGNLENYIDVEQVNFPDRLVHSGAGLRDVGFRRQKTDGEDGEDGEDPDEAERRRIAADDEERERLAADLERIRIQKRERRRRYKESCRSRGKKLKKKNSSGSVVDETPAEEDVVEPVVEENWEEEMEQEVAFAEVEEPAQAGQVAVEDVAGPSTDVVDLEQVRIAGVGDDDETGDIRENIESSEALCASHEKFMQEIRDTYGEPEVPSEIVLYDDPSELVTVEISTPGLFPALNEPVNTVPESDGERPVVPMSDGSQADVVNELDGSSPPCPIEELPTGGLMEVEPAQTPDVVSKDVVINESSCTEVSVAATAVAAADLGKPSCAEVPAAAVAVAAGDIGAVVDVGAIVADGAVVVDVGAIFTVVEDAGVVVAVDQGQASTEKASDSAVPLAAEVAVAEGSAGAPAPEIEEQEQGERRPESADNPEEQLTEPMDMELPQGLPSPLLLPTSAAPTNATPPNTPGPSPPSSPRPGPPPATPEPPPAPAGTLQHPWRPKPKQLRLTGL